MGAAASLALLALLFVPSVCLSGVLNSFFLRLMQFSGSHGLVQGVGFEVEISRYLGD
jgi:hypothetical protein